MPSSSRSAATPPGTMQSIIRRWPKQALAARSTCSRSAPQMRVDEREGGVIADRTDVAEMIGEAFELGHERAQIRPRCGISMPSAASTARAKANA